MIVDSFAMHNAYATYMKPVRIFNNVLFPAPEGPIMAVNSPDLNSPETPFNMVFLTEKKKKNT